MEPKNRTQQRVFIKYVKSLIPQKKKNKNYKLSTAFNDICYHASKILHRTETKQKKVIQ